MLQKKLLDDERFFDILERARLQAPEYMPAWNDFNTHDPGVMLLELLAWLTEAQRFHMSQAGEISAFFPLLGITPMHVSPALATVFLPQGHTLPLPSGVAITAEEVRFETSVPLISGNAVKVIQKHTCIEDIDCGHDPAHIEPATYLSQAGETLLFYEIGGVYKRIERFDKKQAHKTGFPVFSVNAKIPDGARLRAISCEHSSLSLHALGEADGFPNLRFTAQTRGQHILRSEFTLLIAEDRSLTTAQKWELVNDFRASRPADRHYTLDDETGEIVFGDGIRGLMPEGVVFISAMSLTRGEDGNIMAGKLKELTWGESRFPILQPQPAVGGRGREQAHETISRLKAESRQAVTAKDIEKLVLETPGLELKQAQAFENRSGGTREISVAVEPCGENISLTDEQLRRIRLHLEPYRLAGYEFKILSPKYVHINLNVELHTLRRDKMFICDLKEALRDLFHTSFSIFRAHIKVSELTAVLAAHRDVDRITLCDIRAYSAYVRMDAQGNLILDKGALARLDAVHLHVI